MKRFYFILVLVFFPLIIFAQPETASSDILSPGDWGGVDWEDDRSPIPPKYDPMTITKVTRETARLLQAVQDCEFKSMRPQVVQPAGSETDVICSAGGPGKGGRLCRADLVECTIPLFGKIMFEDVYYIAKDSVASGSAGVACDAMRPEEVLKNALKNPFGN